MLLARAMQQQGLATRQGLERGLAAKDKDIMFLRQQLEAAKKLAEDNATARCDAEENLKELEKNFDNYQKEKRKERKKILEGAQKAAEAYQDLLSSVGEETEEAPGSPPRRVYRVDGQRAGYHQSLYDRWAGVCFS
jgi:hypothetical protein